MLKVCPKCGKVIGFNAYFGAYICSDCDWEDNSYHKTRVKYYSERIDKVFDKPTKPLRRS